jgi:transcriptional regulator with XRE-family HTH domain
MKESSVEPDSSPRGHDDDETSADPADLSEAVRAAGVELGDVRASHTLHSGQHGDAVVPDNEELRSTIAIAAARRALGLQLAALRRAAGYSQRDFAPLTGYQRSTVANVETGRQNVPRAFWERCARPLRTDELVAGYDQIEALVIASRQEAARRAQSERDAKVRAWERARQINGTSDAVQFVAMPARRRADEIHVWLSGPGGEISHHLVIPRADASISKLAAVLRTLLESDGLDAEDQDR